MKTIAKLVVMIVHGKIALLVLGVLLFAGMAGCNQSDGEREDEAEAPIQSIEAPQEQTEAEPDDDDDDEISSADTEDKD